LTRILTIFYSGTSDKIGDFTLGVLTLALMKSYLYSKWRMNFAHACAGFIRHFEYKQLFINERVHINMWRKQKLHVQMALARLFDAVWGLNRQTRLKISHSSHRKSPGSGSW